MPHQKTGRLHIFYFTITFVGIHIAEVALGAVVIRMHEKKLFCFPRVLFPLFLADLFPALVGANHAPIVQFGGDTGRHELGEANGAGRQAMAGHFRFLSLVTHEIETHLEKQEELFLRDSVNFLLWCVAIGGNNPFLPISQKLPEDCVGWRTVRCICHQFC